MKKPSGFRQRETDFGFLFLRVEEDGGWVILAGSPDVKLDNKHADRRPHMHLTGWDSHEWRPLRTDLTADEAAGAIARQLNEKGTIDGSRLLEELQ